MQQSEDTPLNVVELEDEIIPAGALVESKQDAIHWISTLVIGWYYS